MRLFPAADVQDKTGIIPEGSAPSLRLFTRDEGIFGGGHDAVFIVTVNSSLAIEEKRAMAVLAIFLRRRGELEFRVVAVFVGIDSVAVYVAVLFSGCEFGTHQSGLFG